MKRIAIAGLALALLPLMGMKSCSAWDQQTYTAASASQAAINDAHAAYEVSAKEPGGNCPSPGTKPCIAHTAKAKQTIEAAVAAQHVLDQAIVTYEGMKANNAAPDLLTKAQLDVATALGSLQPLITDVKALYSAVGGK